MNELRVHGWTLTYPRAPLPLLSVLPLSSSSPSRPCRTYRLAARAPVVYQVNKPSHVTNPLAPDQGSVRQNRVKEKSRNVANFYWIFEMFSALESLNKGLSLETNPIVLR